jgi:predicted dehydrogenase
MGTDLRINTEFTRKRVPETRRGTEGNGGVPAHNGSEATIMVRLGLIGYGYWGPNYARILNELPDCELVGCAEINPAALERARQRLPEVEHTGDHRRLLERRDLDGVIVATPAATHYDVVRDCLEAGKHVLCEKPLTRTSLEASELAEEAEGQGRVLMVGHTFLFNPAVQMLKEYLERGILGKPLYVYCDRLGLGPIRKDVSALWDLAAHDVSILLHLFGDEAGVEDVVARGDCFIQPQIEDVVFLTLRLQERLLANIHVSWLDPAKVRRLTVVGTDKMVVFDDVDPFHRLMLYDKGFRYATTEESFGEFQAVLQDGNVLIPKVPVREPLKEQVTHFLCCIRGEEPCRSDARFAANVVHVLEQAQRSLDIAAFRESRLSPPPALALAGV